MSIDRVLNSVLNLTTGLENLVAVVDKQQDHMELIGNLAKANGNALIRMSNRIDELKTIQELLAETLDKLTDAVLKQRQKMNEQQTVIDRLITVADKHIESLELLSKRQDDFFNTLALHAEVATKLADAVQKNEEDIVTTTRLALHNVKGIATAFTLIKLLDSHTTEKSTFELKEAYVDDEIEAVLIHQDIVDEARAE